MPVSKINSKIDAPSAIPQPSLIGGIANLVGKVARAILVGAIAIIGNLATLCIPLACKIIADLRKKDRKEEIEAKQVEHLYTALTIGLSGDEKWRQNSLKNSFQWNPSLLAKEIEAKGIGKEDAAYFAEKVLKLRNAVYKLKLQLMNGKKVEAGSVGKIFEKFQKYARIERFMQIFRTLEPKDCAPINFLKALAAKFHSADMEELLIQHAKEEIGPVEKDMEGGYSIGKLGEAMDICQRETRFRRDRWYQKIIWAITNPVAFYHSWESQARPDIYNSRESNPIQTIHSVEIPDGKGNMVLARFIAGPSPFNDPVYRKIFLKEGYELRFDIMDTCKKHEYPMVKKLDTIAKESNGHLEHVLFGFQSKKDLGYLNHTDVESLIDGYKDVVLDSRALRDQETDHGVVIAKHQLSDAQIKAACDETKALMQELNPDLTNRKARHAVLVAVDTMMALGIIRNYFQKHQSVLKDPNIDPDMKSVYIATACKQCYDRGPVYLSTLMLFLRSLKSSAPLSEDEFYRIAGLPLFRAPLNEGREQLSPKSEVFHHLTQMLGSRLDLLSKHVSRLQ
ncbi:MAG: hypothetical protein K1X28_08855 [Parachlamydiales bacterium]|nr:hypothetical protein [Parachlamydiales bacterium]